MEVQLNSKHAINDKITELDFLMAIQNCFQYTIPDMMQIQDTPQTNKIDVYNFTNYVDIIPSNAEAFIHIFFFFFWKIWKTQKKKYE